MTQPTLWQQRQTNTPLLVAALVARLDGAGWQTAKQLKADGYGDRTLRAIASASAGRIISGQRGYCLIESATVEDARHAAAWLRHQAAEMNARAADIERAMHRRAA